MSSDVPGGAAGLVGEGRAAHRVDVYAHGLTGRVGTEYDRALDALVRSGRGTQPVRVVTTDRDSGQPVEVTLPAEAATVLYDALTLLSTGCGAAVVPTRRDLSTSQAAGMLGVSRVQFVALLERGELPFRRVGSHRRVRLVDVLDYRRRAETAAAEQAVTLRLALSDEVTSRLHAARPAPGDSAAALART